MSRVLQVSRSGYYKWRSSMVSKRQMISNKRKQLIQDTFKAHHGWYGAPRIHKKLLSEGMKCNLKTIASDMKELGLSARRKKAFKLMDKHADEAVFDNLLQRDFKAEGINQKWVTDITYIRFKERWGYLAVILDLYSRKVISWKLKMSMDSSLVCDTLGDALRTRGYPTGVIMHSDRGSQYTSRDYINMLTQEQLIGSMSRKGNCWDNSAMESFFGTLKQEAVYGQVFTDLAEAQSFMFKYINAYYNTKRRHSTLDFRTPNEVEYN